MGKIHEIEKGTMVFHCPGCEGGHAVRVAGDHPAWGWNGSIDAPTFTPSILIRSGHYSDREPTGTCWCTYNAEHPEDPNPFRCTVCHSFVTDGKIQFLGDCTHKLAGQTVELPEWD